MGKTLTRVLAVPLFMGALAGGLSLLSSCKGKIEISWGNEKPAVTASQKPGSSSSSTIINPESGDYSGPAEGTTSPGYSGHIEPINTADGYAGPAEGTTSPGYNGPPIESENKAGGSSNRASLDQAENNTPNRPAKETTSQEYNRLVEIVNTPAMGGLENYLFRGRELESLKLSYENPSRYNVEDGGALMIPLELFSGNFNSNPAKVKKSELGIGQTKEFFDKLQIEEFGWAAYKIPDEGPYARIHNLDLFLFKFKGNKEAKQFLDRDEARFPAFMRGNTVAVIYSPTFKLVYKNNILTHKQKIMYTDLIFNYRDRTGMELKVGNKQDLEYLEKFRKNMREN